MSNAIVIAGDGIVARYSYSGGGITIPNDVLSIFTFDTLDEDTQGAYSTSTGIFTVPADGDYYVEASIEFAGTITAGTYRQMAIYKNGVIFSILDNRNPPASATNLADEMVGSDIVSCVAGDQLSFYVAQNRGAVLNAGDLGANYNHFYIKKAN